MKIDDPAIMALILNGVIAEQPINVHPAGLVDTVPMLNEPRNGGNK